MNGMRDEQKIAMSMLHNIGVQKDDLSRLVLYDKIQDYELFYQSLALIYTSLVQIKDTVEYLNESNKTIGDPDQQHVMGMPKVEKW